MSSASSPHADSNQGSSEATTILLPSGPTRPTSFMRNISADTKAPHHTSNGKTPLSGDPNYTLQCFRHYPWTRLSPQFHSPRSYLGHFCPHDRHKLLRRRSPPIAICFRRLALLPTPEPRTTLEIRCQKRHWIQCDDSDSVKGGQLYICPTHHSTFSLAATAIESLSRTYNSYSGIPNVATSAETPFHTRWSRMMPSWIY